MPPSSQAAPHHRSCPPRRPNGRGVPRDPTHCISRQAARAHAFLQHGHLIAGKRVVPELIQNDFTPTRVAAEVIHLLNDQAARDQLRSDLAEIRQRLGPPGAVDRAADAILKLLGSAHGNAK